MTQNTTLVFHKPVLVEQVLHYLDPKPGKIYLDVTFGTGGHTRAILEKEPGCKVIALDWDTVAIEKYGYPLQEEFPERLILLWGNFSLLYKLLKEAGIKKVDGILADFGTSQVQILQRPGFSIYKDTALDMRMSPSHQKITAQEVINEASEKTLREIFWEFGEERFAKQIARAICDQRKKKAIKTTKQLADLVSKVVPYKKNSSIHPATRIFQALRIFVNKELENIISFLKIALSVLHPQGRVVCISFHSLEDRIVKQFFKEKEREGKIAILTPKVVTASKKELEENPSSRSAKLRAVELV